MYIIFQFVKLDFPILRSGFYRENRLVKTGDNLKGNKNNVGN